VQIACAPCVAQHAPHCTHDALHEAMVEHHEYRSNQLS
jgi:hypothetical protein